MAHEVREAIQVLKYIKSLKGDYQGFAKHTNSKDIHTISTCCFNLLEDNIPLPTKKKKSIKLFLMPIEKEIKLMSKRNSSLKQKRDILSDPQIGHGILTLLATTILPALISTFIK